MDSDAIDPAGCITLVPLEHGRCRIELALDQKFKLQADAEGLTSIIFETFQQAKEFLNSVLSFPTPEIPPPNDARTGQLTHPIDNISREVKPILKRLVAESDPYPASWDWHPGTWRWELLLRDREEDLDAGYVFIVPLKDGQPFKHGIKPAASHDAWAIGFVVNLAEWGVHIPDDLFEVRGTLPEVKHQLDMLLAAETPSIPSFEKP
jgi:hypothetical protein